MRIGSRVALLGSMIAVVLLAASAYGRGSVDYGGTVEKDPNTAIAFDVNGPAKHRKVQSLTVYGVNVACDADSFSGRQGTLAFGDKALKVTKKGKFKGSVTKNLLVRAVGFPTKYSIQISGKIKGKKAGGTVSVHLSGGGTHCYSGSLKWKAKKPPPNG
jgi:hypothetical protein